MAVIEPRVYVRVSLVTTCIPTGPHCSSGSDGQVSPPLFHCLTEVCVLRVEARANTGISISLCSLRHKNFFSARLTYVRELTFVWWFWNITSHLIITALSKKLNMWQLNEPPQFYGTLAARTSLFLDFALFGTRLYPEDGASISLCNKDAVISVR
jgi:hypothetical protein